IAGPHEGVDGHQCCDLARPGEVDGLGQLLAREVQPREITGIGLVAEPAIDGVRADFDGVAERRWRAGRTDEFHYALPRSSRRSRSNSQPRRTGTASGPARAPTAVGRSRSESSSALRSARVASVSPEMSSWRAKNRASP